MNDKLPLLVCVDDEQEVLNALHRIFRPDFMIHTFTKVDDAVHFIETCEQDIPVVMSDFKMSPVNGIDFLKKIKTISPSSTRIILSGQMEVQDLSGAINQQIIHKFFLKPWDNQMLKIQIQEALQTHSLISEKNKYKKLSITDPITQLTNHRFFQQQMRAEVKKASAQSPLSLLMIDVDHFKSFNDQFGHPEGDKLLRSISDKLKNSIHGKPHSVSRYGGEEFTIILPETSKSNALEIAEKIRSDFAGEAFYQGTPQQALVTLSIGVSTCPEDSLSASELVEMADQALYQAKDKGRNKVLSA